MPNGGRRQGALIKVMRAGRASPCASTQAPRGARKPAAPSSSINGTFRGKETSPRGLAELCARHAFLVGGAGRVGLRVVDESGRVSPPSYAELLVTSQPPQTEYGGHFIAGLNASVPLKAKILSFAPGRVTLRWNFGDGTKAELSAL